MTTLFNDIKYATRILIKRPGFSLTIIVILALGIGANTAIFSVVNTVLVKPLPYDQPDRIVRIREDKLDVGLRGVAANHPTIDYWRQHNTMFEHIAAIQSHRFYITTGREKSFHLRGRAVSSCYFSIMGMSPMLGRDFLLEDEQTGHEQVVILSHEFWTKHFESDPQVVGQSLLLNEKSYTILGVMPAEYRDSLRRCAPFWVPLPLNLKSWGGGTNVMARLKVGVDLAQAQAELSTLEERMIQQHPEHKSGYTVRVNPYFESQLDTSRSYLYPIWGAIGLVLLVGCLNASGLFLVHGDMRRKEIAVRTALGASRLHIVRQMLTEGVILSSIAGGVGTILAFWAIKSLVIMAPLALPRLSETQIDTRTLGFTLGVSILTGLVFGLVPAWKTTSFRLSESMKQGFSGQVRHQRRVQGFLVVSQIGIALTMIFAVALLIHSVMRIYQTELGFSPENTLVAEFELPKVKYPKKEDSSAFYQQLQQRLQTQPGVSSVAYVSGGLTLGGGGGFIGFTIDGVPAPLEGQKPWTRHNSVSANFFQTMGMTIKKGRDFTEQDVQQKARVCIIDENMAAQYFPDRDPIGQGISGNRIVGVVSTLRDYESLSPDIVTMYAPVTDDCFVCSDVVVKASGDPMSIADVVRAQVAEMDPDLAIKSLYALKDNLSDMLAPRRYIAMLLGLFALIALLLAAIGIFGLLQYIVVQCTQEIGIRMALGATQNNITSTFLRRGVILIFLGTVLGFAGGFAAKRILASLLFEARLTDPGLVITAMLILFSTGLLACYIPARRAAKIDPMEALRYE